MDCGNSLYPASKREFAVGTAEQLESKLTGYGYACPHFPKFRNRESGYPSCLGFFYGNDANRVSYVEVEKLCKTCLSEIIPTSKDYNVWLSSGVQVARGGALKENCVWNTPQPSIGFQLDLIQGGTAVHGREVAGPPAIRERAHRGFYNSPVTITIAMGGLEEEAWSWLMKSGKPFYIEQLHLVKKQSPWAVRTAMEDFRIAKGHGNCFSPPAKVKPTSKIDKRAVDDTGSLQTQPNILPTRTTISNMDRASDMTEPKSDKIPSPGNIPKPGKMPNPGKFPESEKMSKPKKISNPENISNPEKISKYPKANLPKLATGEALSESSKKSILTSEDASMESEVKTGGHSKPRAKARTIPLSTPTTREPSPTSEVIIKSHQKPVAISKPQIGSASAGQMQAPLKGGKKDNFIVARLDSALNKTPNKNKVNRTASGSNMPRTYQPTAKLVSSGDSISNAQNSMPSALAETSVNGIGLLAGTYGTISPIPLGSPMDFARSQSSAENDQIRANKRPYIFQQLLQASNSFRNRGQTNYSEHFSVLETERNEYVDNVIERDIYAFQPGSSSNTAYWVDRAVLPNTKRPVTGVLGGPARGSNREPIPDNTQILNVAYPEQLDTTSQVIRSPRGGLEAIHGAQTYNGSYSHPEDGYSPSNLAGISTAERQNSAPGPGRSHAVSPAAMGASKSPSRMLPRGPATNKKSNERTKMVTEPHKDETRTLVNQNSQPVKVKTTVKTGHSSQAKSPVPRAKPQNNSSHTGTPAHSSSPVIPAGPSKINGTTMSKQIDNAPVLSPTPPDRRDKSQGIKRSSKDSQHTGEQWPTNHSRGSVAPHSEPATSNNKHDKSLVASTSSDGAKHFGKKPKDDHPHQKGSGYNSAPSEKSPIGKSHDKLPRSRAMPPQEKKAAGQGKHPNKGHGAHGPKVSSSDKHHATKPHSRRPEDGPQVPRHNKNANRDNRAHQTSQSGEDGEINPNGRSSGEAQRNSSASSIRSESRSDSEAEGPGRDVPDDQENTTDDGTKWPSPSDDDDNRGDGGESGDDDGGNGEVESGDDENRGDGVGSGSDDDGGDGGSGGDDDGGDGGNGGDDDGGDGEGESGGDEDGGDREGSGSDDDGGDGEVESDDDDIGGDGGGSGDDDDDNSGDGGGSRDEDGGNGEAESGEDDDDGGGGSGEDDNDGGDGGSGSDDDGGGGSGDDDDDGGDGGSGRGGSGDDDDDGGDGGSGSDDDGGGGSGDDDDGDGGDRGGSDSDDDNMG
ncbi:hypothetical protein BP6252_13275 [Coleophoma cylindrospora]|uniref:Uncharacterized protein n=1 Tax=Coleophoma cylindrospora TaxID=1849047 RepID=A0A3D8QAH9_9HELO|nr:hypothetical protein BP6252_13275 [Coleophoma cylindrospora]